MGKQPLRLSRAQATSDSQQQEADARLCDAKNGHAPLKNKASHAGAHLIAYRWHQGRRMYFRKYMTADKLMPFVSMQSVTTMEPSSEIVEDARELL